MNSRLTVAKTTDDNIEEVKVLAASGEHVDMHFVKKSTRTPLISSSFANCLGVVIHDASKGQGYLMHIFPAYTNGLSQDASFHYLDTQILKAVNSFAGNADVQVLLWKGVSYTPHQNNSYTDHYADHLQTKVADRVSVVDCMDKGRGSVESTIVYHPRSGGVFIVSDKHESDIAALVAQHKVKLSQGNQLPIIGDCGKVYSQPSVSRHGLFSSCLQLPKLRLPKLKLMLRRSSVGKGYTRMR